MQIKSTRPKKGRFIKNPPSELDKLRTLLNNHPVFCFQFLQRGFTIDDCNQQQRAVFIKRICDLSGLKWSQIQIEPRDGIGAEKMPYATITARKPDWITRDSEFLSFRFCGDRCRFLGFQNDFIFHVIYIDPNLRSYRH
jgi:hypothetical protein